MTLSPEALSGILARHPPAPRYWVAYSGGLDSHVLLHLCARLQRPGQPPHFAAVHVHHGLQPQAEAWAEHCQATCQTEGLPFRLLRVDARAAPGESPEEAARKARYRALAALLCPGETVLTAHHRDDQAETLLLQLVRGAGLAGLAGMPARGVLGPGWLLRPLLEFSRAELRAYAEAERLRWIEDPSNENLAYDRNFIRERVLPLIRTRWPRAEQSISRAAQHCAEAQELLAALGRERCRSARHPARPTLQVERLRALPAPERRLAVREWLRGAGLRPPSSRVLEQILHSGLDAGPNRNPVIRWRAGEVRRYRDELYLLPPTGPFDAGAVIPWDGRSVLRLPDGNGELTAVPVQGPGIAPARWEKGAITVRYRHGGETCQPVGRPGARELKKLFQEAGIPPWVRERTPLIYIDNRLAAVGEWWICEAAAGAAGERNVAVRWRAPAWCTGI